MVAYLSDKGDEEIMAYQFEVVRSYPHTTTDYTQGIYMESPNTYIESTGMYGESKL
jgi:glutamine cyclotransferase